MILHVSLFLDHILSFVLGIVGGLGLKDLKTTERWTIQLRVILGRMKRSHIRLKVTKAWVDACDEMQTSTGVIGIPAEPAIVCGLVGCETVVAATMMCGRCKETFYCSAECQKSCVSSTLLVHPGVQLSDTDTFVVIGKSTKRGANSRSNYTER